MDTVSDPRIAFFDELAERWDQEGQSPTETVTRVAGLADRLGLEPGQAVLEVGCGTGQLTAWLAEQVSPGKVVAIDFAPAMLAEARTKGIQAEFRVADVCSDDLEPKSFDVILCFHSFPHFRRPQAALTNFAGALKPGGRLIVMHLCGSDAVNAFHTEVGGAVAEDHLPAAADWPFLLDAAGLQLGSLTDCDDLFLLVAAPRRRC